MASLQVGGAGESRYMASLQVGGAEASYRQSHILLPEIDTLVLRKYD